MLRQFAYLTTGCMICLLTLLSSCGIFETEEFTLNAVVDCPELNLNVQDSCLVMVGDTSAGAMWGLVNENCDCVTDFVNRDCPALGRNIGDVCRVRPDVEGIVTDSCTCEEPMDTLVFDCPNIQGNLGDSCVGTMGLPGVIIEGCRCDSDGRDTVQLCTREFQDSCRQTGGVTVNTPNGCVCDPLIFCAELNLPIGDSCRRDSIYGIVLDDCTCG